MKKGISEKVQNEVVELYRQGLMIKSIAWELDISTATITRIVREAINQNEIEPRHGNFGKPRPPKGAGKGYHYEKRGYATGMRKLTEEQQRAVVEDYANGVPYKEMMEKYGVWQGTLRSVINKAIAAGVTPPRGRGKGKRRKTK